MKIMRCPLNGDRNISEFICYGEVIEMPEPNRTNDSAWADYMWNANNTAGVVQEWWCHTPSSYWFIAERNTISDEVIRTYPSNELFSTRKEYKAKL